MLVEFFKHYKINPKTMHQGSLLVIVASLNQTAGNAPELKPKDNGNDLECQVKKQKLVFSEFIKEYFLEEAPISLFLG